MYKMAQTLNLLTTKLNIPSVRGKLVARPRLTERLNRALNSKLTLVSAPAGFGKTTILAEWRATPAVCDVPVAWVSLDERDQDPLLFWGYVIKALDRYIPGLAEKLLPVLCMPQAPSLEAILTDLLNRLQSCPTDFLLVLDDYHSINNQQIHQTLSFLLEHLPSQMHLVILSRADPPLPLPRLRVRGQLTELRAEDLRFSLSETGAFLNRTMGLGLSSSQLQALEERTEGWVAGLQLAGLSLQKREDIEGFIAGFSGSHRYMLDYIVEEVLEQQTPTDQEFLLHTAILERLSGSLCEAVSGQPGGQIILERLERANLFLVSLDDERQWYRYHHLFSQLLRYRLLQTAPARLLDLYRRAGQWCEANALPDEALHYYLSGGFFEEAAELLEKVARKLVMRGRLMQLLNWLDRLPAELMNRHPRLCIAYAWARSFSGQVEAAAAYTDRAEAALALVPDSSETFKELWGEIRAFRTTMVTSYHKDFREGSRLAEQALADIPPDNLYLRSWVMRNVGEGFLMSGDLAAAERGYETAIRLSQASSNNFMLFASVYGLGQAQIAQGKLGQAAQTYQQALQQFSPTDGPPLPVTSYAHIGLAEVLREWNELDAALFHAQTGLDLAQQGGFTTLAIWSYTALAQVRQALGDFAGAREAQQGAHQEVQKYRPRYYSLREGAYNARLSLLQQDLAAAESWAVSYLAQGRREAQEYSYALLEFLDITLARVWLAHGRTDEALGYLRDLENKAASGQSLQSLIEIKLLRALAQPEKSFHVLREVLMLAEPGGYVRLFTDLGTKLAPMLAKLEATEPPGRLKTYLERLLASCPFANGAVTESNHKPLTERELEVLHLLSAGQSLSEIAGQLIISLETVKKHRKNIYSKLNAHSRFEAQVRAKELRLF
jgi:LuxR family transcriptional regulator, maltose regulon positive regulatory protein